MSDESEKLDQFKLDVARDFDATEESREASNEDVRFVGVTGGQWEGYLEESHSPDKARARLELDITSDYVNRYVGEWTMNRANVTFTESDDSTTDADAELMSGVYRADFKDNDGQISQDNAVYETSVCGHGAFKYSTRFVDEEDPENESQEIIYEPIANAYSHVIFDCNAKRIDKADAKHVTVLSGYSPEAFEAEWPEANKASAFTPTTYNGFEWSTREVVYVAERYEIKEIKEEVQVWQHIIQNEVKAYNKEQFELLEDELKALGWEYVRTRKMKRRTVWKTIFSGDQILEEEKRIAGKFLPIIPMYGVRTYVDNKEHWRGLVRPLKDAGRLFNTFISKIAESSASSSDAKPILTRRQVEGLENNWANSADSAYHVINDLEDAQGNQVASGPVGMMQPGQVDPSTLAGVEIVSNFVQRMTGGAPQDTVDPNASGKAINALRARENLNTQLITDNINQAIKHSGMVYRAIAADIYTRSQMKKIIGLDGKASMVQLNSETLDPQSGNLTTINDLSRGRFSVDVEVGPQYESQKEATIESIEKMLSMLDVQSPYYGPLLAVWMDNISGTGLDPLKEFNRRIMLSQGLVTPETPEEQQQVDAQSQQTDPNDELVKAATKQQNAEAENLIASSEQKRADAQYKKAQAVEKVVDIGIKRAEHTFRKLQGV